MLSFKLNEKAISWILTERLCVLHPAVERPESYGLVERCVRGLALHCVDIANNPINKFVLNILFEMVAVIFVLPACPF